MILSNNYPTKVRNYQRTSLQSKSPGNKCLNRKLKKYSLSLIHPQSCTMRKELIIKLYHMSHAARNYCIIAALCKSNKDNFESKIIMNRLFHSLYIFLNLWCLYFLSVGLLVKKMSTLSKKKDVLFSEMTIISCKLRNTKEGCLHMAQNQLYPELIIDFSRSCLI